MRNFRIASIIYFFITIMLTLGCEKLNYNNLPQQGMDSSKYIETDGNSENNSGNLNEMGIESALFVYESTGDLIDIRVTYPQIVQMRDYLNCEFKDTLNKQIFDDILVDFAFFEFQNTRISANINFDIAYLSEDVICVIYYGETDSGTRPTLFTHTAVFDIRTGEKLPADDYFTLIIDEIISNQNDGLKSELIQKLYADEIKKAEKQSANIEIGYYETDLNGDGYNDIIAVVQDYLSGKNGDELNIWANSGNGNYEKILLFPLFDYLPPLSEVWEREYYPRHYFEIYIIDKKTNKFNDIIMVTDSKFQLICFDDNSVWK